MWLAFLPSVSKRETLGKQIHLELRNKSRAEDEYHGRVGEQETAQQSRKQFAVPAKSDGNCFTIYIIIE